MEEQARQLYASLIENLGKDSNQLDVRVFVGSASYGHSTHLLFSHFVEHILPKNAHEQQLLQRMKSDCVVAPVPPALPPPLPRARAPRPAPRAEVQTSPLAAEPASASAEAPAQWLNGKM